jgi:hypothetical protein
MPYVVFALYKRKNDKQEKEVPLRPILNAPTV